MIRDRQIGRNLIRDIKNAIQVEVMPEEDFFGDAQPVDYEWDLLDFSADRLLL